MEASRIDSMDAPRGAARGPLLLLGVVFSIVAAALLIGLFERGWLFAITVPALAITVAITARVLRLLWLDRRELERK